MSEKLKRGGGYCKIRMGSLYLDGIEASTFRTMTPFYKNQAFITIGDTVYGHELTWIKPPNTNKFIADRVILRGISWKDLEKLGLNNSRYVIIDGNLFNCRLLEYNTDDYIDEWDEVLELTGDENDLWNWKGESFWVNNPELDGSPNATLMGGDAPLHDRHESAGSKDLNIGYRPILECIQRWVIFKGPVVHLDEQLFGIYALKTNIVRFGKPENFVSLMMAPQTKKKDTEQYVFTPSLIGQQIPDHIDMFTILVDGQPTITGEDAGFIHYHDGMTFEMTDRFYTQGHLMRWRIEDGLCFTRDNILRNISDTDLEALGFVPVMRPWKE